MKNFVLKFYNQLSLRITLLILFFVFTMIGLFFISTKSNLEEYLKVKVPNLYTIIKDEIVYTIFKHQVVGVSFDENIPKIKLVLSRKDIAHFAELYRRYETEGGQIY